MLIDIEEKKKAEGELTESRRGACRFCGQISIVEVPVDWEDDKVDDLVTETCKCDKAEVYRYKQSRKDKAVAGIEKQFGEERVSKEAMDILKEAVNMVLDGHCDTVQINVGNIKGKVSINAKGAIKVEKTKTEKESKEA